MLLIIGISTSLAALLFFIVKMFLGNKELLIPTGFVIAYIMYITPTMFAEYKACKLDKENGLEEAIMELYDVKIFGKRANDDKPALPLVTFKGKGENYITLGGDFSKIELIKGKKYKIKFYKHSKMLVNIESVQKKNPHKATL